MREGEHWLLPKKRVRGVDLSLVYDRNFNRGAKNITEEGEGVGGWIHTVGQGRTVI